MKKAFLFSAVFCLFFIGCNESGNVYEIEYIDGYPVVTGSENGLMWYIDDPDNPTTKLNQMTYPKAEEYCSNLDHCGFNDWRLPTISELRTLVTGYKDIEPGGRCKVTDDCLDKFCLFRGQKSDDDYPCSNKNKEEEIDGPGPDGCYFDNIWRQYCGKYWSGSEVNDSSNQVFQIEFLTPSIITAGKESSYVGFARCIRKKH
jgi:hypothetical protein